MQEKYPKVRSITMKNIDINRMRKNAAKDIINFRWWCVTGDEQLVTAYAKRIFMLYRLGLVSRSTWKRAIKMKSDVIEWVGKIRLEGSDERT